eukprot:SAG11_NODE_734_length_7466_cov_3.388625_2_plen_203_part_00
MGRNASPDLQAFDVTGWCSEALGEIKERVAKCMRRTKGAKSNDIKRHLWQQLSKEHKECRDIAEEKVSLAEQTYDMVDGHVRRLDDVLRNFEAELRQIDPERLAELKLAAVQTEPFVAAGLSSRKRSNAIMNADGMHSDIPVDPNEPRYCYCRQVSFGEMVACDNADCEFEWFHYACVGLSAAPQGAWLCPTCAKHEARRKR